MPELYISGSKSTSAPQHVNLDLGSKVCNPSQAPTESINFQQRVDLGFDDSNKSSNVETFSQALRIVFYGRGRVFGVPRHCMVHGKAFPAMLRRLRKLKLCGLSFMSVVVLSECPSIARSMAKLFQPC